MPFKSKIEKSAYDALAGDSEWQKKAYKVDPGNANQYILDAEPDEGLAGALSGKQFEKDRADKNERDLAAMTTDRDTHKAKAEGLETEKRAGWKKDPDRDAIETDLRGKLTEAEKNAATAKEVSDKKLSDYIRDSEANSMAEAISTVPTMMAKEIKERLTVDVSGDKPITRVLDKDGKPCASSLSDLRKEFVDNAAYKSVIKASDASGGGAGPGGSGGGSTATKAFKDMSEVERTDLYKSNPAEFRRLNSEHQAASVGM